MQWELLFSNKEDYSNTQFVWNNMNMPIANRLSPKYDHEKSMILKAKEIGPYYNIPHLYRYWNQRAKNQERIQSNFSYQLDRTFLQKLWPSGLFSDVVLVVEDQEFKVHRSVLGVSSRYFEVLFSKMRESVENRIVLQEISQEPFRELIKLLYGYPITLSGISTLEILSLIRRFEVHEISDQELQEIISVLKISQEEIFEFIQITQEIYEDHPEWLMAHFFDIIHAPIELMKEYPVRFQEYFKESYYIEENVEEDLGKY